MSWPRILFPVFLITISIFTGVASGQGHYELQEHGQQPSKNNITSRGQWPQPLQTDLVNREQQSNPKTAGSKPNFKNKQTSKVGGIKRNAKGKISKTDSFKFSSNQHGVDQVKRVNIRPQIGASGSGLLGMRNNQSGGSGSSGSASFLDGYLLKSLHDGRLAEKKKRREEKSKDDKHPKR